MDSTTDFRVRIMKNILVKSITAVLAIIMMVSAVVSMVSCDENNAEDAKDATLISFKAGSSYQFLKSLNGKKVTINGYIGSSSDIKGKSLFLMNLPNQSCPFCKPNTSELANTMEVYPKSGKKFDYKDYDSSRVVRVVGTLVVADEGKYFTDDYGYEFSFKIVDATYSFLKSSEMSESMTLAKKLTDMGLESSINSMFEYVHFTCAWNTYTSGVRNEDGSYKQAWYLYPSDAENYIKQEKAQFNYGYVDGYFDGLIRQVRAVDAEKLEDLVKIIENARVLAQKGLDELANGNYTSEYKDITIGDFSGKEYVYTLNNGEELYNEWEALYYEWQGYFEL